MNRTLLRLWDETNGQEGVEPTPEMYELEEIYETMQVTVDEAEQKALFRRVLALYKERLYAIGICTAPPEVVVVKNDFRNVPEIAVSDWQLLTPGATAPEQYFIES
jgi:ABC-type transport system substrate-binding protein